jgi:hypothetical protein
MHELFFVEFPCLLHEWLKRKEKVNPTVLPLESIVWDQSNIDILKEMDYKWMRDIDFWFSRVKEGYIIEFSIEYSDYFREAERKFEEGPRKWMF